MNIKSYLKKIASEGGKARAKTLTAKQRSDIARHAGKASAKARKVANGK